MSMPSLVYVLGLSGAVHIVNYYRETVRSTGLQGAPARALAHGYLPRVRWPRSPPLWVCCRSARAISIPIRKFGIFSAVGVMATLVLLFTYLPSALQLWPPSLWQRTEPAWSTVPAATDPRGSGRHRGLDRRPSLVGRRGVRRGH